MDTRLSAALKAWRTRYPGEESNWRRLHAWLLDHAPTERKAAKALSAVGRLELHKHLALCAGKKLDPFTFRRVVDALTAEEGLSADLAEGAILLWAVELGVEAPDASVLRGPLDKGVVTASLDATRCLHLALVSSDVRPISQVRVESLTQKPLAELTVSVWLTGVEVGSSLRSTTWTGQVERLKARQVAQLDRVSPAIAPQPLHELKGTTVGRWWIEVKQRDEVLLRTFQDVEVAPPRQWVFGRAPLQALAAFVQPGDAIVAELVGEAASRVLESDARPAAIRALEALRAVLDGLGLTLERATPDLIVGPRAVITGARASWLELQLLMAACLEHAGLSPLLVWASSGPALGLWTGAERPALTETDDPVLLARLSESGVLSLVPVGDHVVRLSEETSETLKALDLASARRAGVLPLPGLVLDDGRLPPVGSSSTPPVSPSGVEGQPGASSTSLGQNGGASPPSPAELRQRLLDRAALSGNRSGLLLPGGWSAKLSRGIDGGDSKLTSPRLQAWKRRLLDLTLNNPLLNLRTRVTSLPLLIADLGALEDALASGQQFGLLARPTPTTGGAVTVESMKAAMAAGSVLVDLPANRVATQAKNAVRAHREALDEGGMHTLFLALGALEWFDAATPTVPRLAPLLLVPALLRRSRHGHYETKKAEGDAEFNAALLEMLRREHGVEIPGVVPLPGDGSGVDVRAVFEGVRTALAKSPTTVNWKVKEDAQLATISFSGFRMWRDLDHQAADLMRHPLVHRLASGGDTTEPFQPLDASTLDAQWPPKDVFCPLDADASQLSAVLTASSGKSFVLEGPPGTGKSQTIANLVAQCLANGKSVLFVAQKRAALEVVQARLDAIGLGPFLLELHSKKASKPEFIAQLRAAAEFRAKKPPREWESEADALATARKGLNDVVRALHVKRAPGLSVYDAISELHLRQGEKRLDAGFDSARAFDAQWQASAKAELADLGPSFSRLSPGWKELDAVRAPDWTSTRKSELEGRLSELKERAGTLREMCVGLAEWFPGLEDASADSLELVDQILADVQTTPRPRAELLAGAEEEVEAWVKTVEGANTAAAGLTPSWSPALLAQPLDDWHGKLKQWLGVFLLGWFVLALTVRWAARRVVKSSVPKTPALLGDVERAMPLKKTRDALATQAARISTLLGPQQLDEWELPRIDAAALRKLCSWSRAFRNRAARYPRAVALAVEGAPGASTPIEAYRAAFAAYVKAQRVVIDALELSGSWTRPAEGKHLEASVMRAERIRENTGQLREWGGYRRNRDACVALGLSRAVKALERGEVPAAELVAQFTCGWFAWWLEQRVLEDKVLASFDGLKQRGHEERFAQADRDLRDLASDEIRARLAARLPRLDQGAPPTSQAGILLRQFSRRVGFASPRQLFSECSGLIRQLKPCVLMSPQSVAQFLDPSQPPFDIVVFDEASQVPTHEAIGAIARGRQVVVVGDTKQLPPTSFFMGAAKEEDSEDDEVFTELDSILEECAASGLPSLQLTWHYRSRHPSLIAFSNSRYYSDRLQLLPAAQARAPHLGVSRVLVKGKYDRGHTATNRIEAEALVAELVRRLKDPREQRRSVAVLTFSRAQQALIEDLLEEAEEQWPELEPFLSEDRKEPLIVKNLENIQGDERDVVLFSVGYGPDALGKMTANLGPLGQLGGERRLNVAVTRAREQLVVFVSFEAAQLDLSGSSSRGLHDLKAFLDAAANGGDVATGANAGEEDAADATLKRALQGKLEAAGYTADLNVGIGRYRLDLAVHHPDEPHRYVLGIELDGARYAGTDTARDRERLRRESLTGLGWTRLLRVRALDWHEAPERVMAEVLQLVEEARREVLTAPPLDPVPLPLPAAAEPEPQLAPEPEAPVIGGEITGETVYRPALIATDGKPFAWTSQAVANAVSQIVVAEGPVSERVLGRRLADAWSLKRAPTGFSGALPGLLGRLVPGSLPVWRAGFLWPAKVNHETWREYRVADAENAASRRDVEDICVEELANAADALVKRYGNMSREDLARALAKRFGYRGLTKGVHQRMEEGIDFATARTSPRTAGA